MNYENDVKIDQDNLDLEWLEQPSFMLSYTKHMARCEKRLELIKETLDVITAQIDKDIRINPNKYGLEKLTETVIRNTIIQEKQYEDVKEKMIEAKYEYDIAKGAVMTFQHRKNALENLVTLHGQHYFAGPSVPKQIDRDWEKEMKNKRANKKVKIKRSN